MGQVKDYIYEIVVAGLEALHKATERANYLGLSFDIYQQEPKGAFAQDQFVIKFFVQKKPQR